MFAPARITILAALLMFSTQTAFSCTTFLLENDGKPIFGRNYDWYLEDAMVLVNKRNVQKTAAFLDEPGGQPAQWTSKYGSVTFNQISREFPCGGMNEAGLVVEVMVILTPSKAKPDTRPVITTLQWIQYQLDNYTSVAEVVAHASDLCIREQAGVPLHYLVGDETGAAASIEVLGGKIVCHTGDSLPVKVLTNDNYRRSYYAMRRFQNFNGDRPEPMDRASQTRFIRASKRVEAFTPRPVPEAVDYAFETLHVAFMADLTKWTIVYDIAGRRIYFRTHTRPDIRHIDLGPLDFSCKTPVQMMDINRRGTGNVTEKFRDYSAAANKELVGKSFDLFSFLKRHREQALKILSGYPDTTVCAE